MLHCWHCFGSVSFSESLAFCLRVVADNDSCEDATVILVDSVNKHGTLLQVVQVLADMNLTIKKSYISSDGGWFMDDN